MSKARQKGFFTSLTFKKAIWLAPVLYLFHIIEEGAFGFHVFMTTYRGQDLTFEGFIIVNAVIMLSYFLMNGIFTIYSNRLTAFFALGGIIAAQFFNAFFHLIMTIHFGAYCPGLITGFTLYVPFVILLVRMAYREGYITKTRIVVLFILGAIMMTAFEFESLRPIVFFGWLGIAVTTTILYRFTKAGKTGK